MQILDVVLAKLQNVEAVQQSLDVVRVTFREEGQALAVLQAGGVRLFDMWCRVDGVLRPLLSTFLIILTRTPSNTLHPSSLTLVLLRVCVTRSTSVMVTSHRHTAGGYRSQAGPAQVSYYQWLHLPYLVSRSACDM